jgi:hypothetical protein
VAWDLNLWALDEGSTQIVVKRKHHLDVSPLGKRFKGAVGGRVNMMFEFGM